MVLLAAAICTRSGAIVVSRQFLSITRQRVELLLSQFPRLLQAGQQHTFVETDDVRFVYQPLEAHYLVLISSKASNILQDMETLRMLARVVGEYVGPAEEASQLSSVAIEILLAFDEVITAGWREPVNMSQLQTILAMESQEEIVQEIIAKNKMQETKEAAKRKIKQIEMEKRETARRNSAGSKNTIGGGYSGLSSAATVRGADSLSNSFMVAPKLQSQQPSTGPTIQTTTRAGKGKNQGGVGLTLSLRGLPAHTHKSPMELGKDGLSSISDASDWPCTEMREFERKLRCPICHDFIRTCLLLRTCSHNCIFPSSCRTLTMLVCSLCIRRSLATLTECPVCRVTSATTDLEVNRLIDELVQDFTAVRSMILENFEKSSQQDGEAGSTNLIDVHPIDNESSQEERTRKSARLHLPNRPRGPSGPPETSAECPICNGIVPLLKIEQHVELCLIKGSSTSPPAPLVSPTVPLKRINKPVYNLLKDSELKKLLQELQLPISGDRDQMIRRHSEFLFLYNAECDSLRPKSMGQLRAELRAIERTWDRKPSSPLKMVGDPEQKVEDEDFDQFALTHKKKHAEHFRKLIEKAKRNSNKG